MDAQNCRLARQVRLKLMEMKPAGKGRPFQTELTPEMEAFCIVVDDCLQELSSRIHRTNTRGDAE